MSTPPKQYDARVVSAQDVSPDIRVLRVMLADGGLMPFRAGQYAFLEAAGHDPRAFSIASSPGDPVLEFHIKSAGHGISAHVVRSLSEGAALIVKGPFGANVLQDDSRPFLALAGGIGIAPMKAIVEARLKASISAPVYLYWGARDVGQLYLDARFRELAAAHAHFHYIPLLSDVPSGGTFRKGFVGQAVAEDFTDLAAFSVYMAGPKAMIEVTTPLLLEKGVQKDHIFSDAFSI
jgi:CDP-4-dehydro-6-deoxyglucose reductase/ferredoxin-NAD(P)+ reductase (naphthalene dioxygenase ferredoxin-specific)